MARYVFDRWEDGSANPTRVIPSITAAMAIVASYAEAMHNVAFTSTPIAVQFTVNGQPVPSGTILEVPEGVPITISVPPEVTV